MKVKRHKRVHKYISFFCNNFGFRQPYQVLIDGTFCYAALKNKVNIRDQLPKYLEGDVKFLTTQCVVIEVENLGSAVFGAMLIVKQFGIHKCGHEKKPVPGSTCLLSMLGETNTSRYILATQDRELEVLASRVPGTPVLYLHQKTPVLQPPSDASTSFASSHTQALFGVRQHEEETIKNLKKRFGLVEEETIKKRKKKRGPNPLSCKKKKKKTVQNVEKPEQKRRRKRIKLPKHVKEVLKSEVLGQVQPKG
ncbi:rRNA-processing protein UTP23 homolog [Bacillus rossius redtenbacheri]|uniref:rRNA-processing protein UTP23 homolog n=1 Tax=Bacillus rossius redtenbacheri TaxID=93214 RepID=UPI002FDDE5C2